MAPYVQPIPDPLHGYVYLLVDWTADPTETHTRIVRIDSGTSEELMVRTHTSSDTTGDYIQLSEHAIIVYDSEAPLDRPIRYRVEGLVTGYTETSDDLWLSSGAELWLKDPLRPACNMRLHLKQQASSENCEPGKAKFFTGLGGETFPSRGTLITIHDSKFPATANRVRGSLSSTLNIVTRTLIDREDVEDICATGDDLLLQGPDVYGIGNRYMMVADPNISRIMPDHRIPWRSISIPHTEVDVTAGMSYGVTGTRWMDTCTTCATFQDLTFDLLTWEDAMLGRASLPVSGPTTSWITYDEVNARFVDYDDVYDGGSRTYQELLEGH